MSRAPTLPLEIQRALRRCGYRMLPVEGPHFDCYGKPLGYCLARAYRHKQTRLRRSDVLTWDIVRLGINGALHTVTSQTFALRGGGMSEREWLRRLTDLEHHAWVQGMGGGGTETQAFAFVSPTEAGRSCAVDVQNACNYMTSPWTVENKKGDCGGTPQQGSEDCEDA